MIIMWLISFFFFFFFFDAPIKNKEEIYEKILKRKIIMTLLHEMYLLGNV